MGLEHNWTEAQWDWDTMALNYNGTGVQRAWDTILEHSIQLSHKPNPYLQAT